MGSFLDIKTWLVCGILCLLLRWRNPRHTMWFGALNLGALALLAGIPVALSALLFALLAWTMLAGARGARARWLPGHARLASCAALAALALPIVVFVVHKLAMEHPEIAAWFEPAGLLAGARPLVHLVKLLAFSYVVLRYLDCAHCVLWKAMPLLDPLSLAGFLFPFHMILSGPINRYDEHLKMNTLANQSNGTPWLAAVNDVTTGLVFKYVLAEYLRVFAFGQGAPLVSSSWLDTALLFLYMFFDFAGYSRIVVGIGRLLKVPTPVNFASPFLAVSITEFFTRWHMSLGAFILRNIYTPLQLHWVRSWGIKKAVWAGLLALLSAWIVVGLWHRLTPGFLGYGLLMAVIVWVEKTIRDRLRKAPWAQSKRSTLVWTALGPVYVFVVMTTMIHLVIGEILQT